MTIIINVVANTGVAAIHRALQLLTGRSEAEISPTFLQSVYARIKQDRDDYYPEIEHDCNYPLPFSFSQNYIELENAEPGFYAAFTRLFTTLRGKVLALEQTTSTTRSSSPRF